MKDQNENKRLPDAFIKRLNTDEIELEKFLTSMREPAAVSVRLNAAKPSQIFKDGELIPWCRTGRYLPERINFTLDPFFHAGAYYVQEASSMLIEEALIPYLEKGKRIVALDLCAAPGGKSTHLLNLLPDDSILVSNEIIPSRNSILKYNLLKWGYANTLVTQSQAKDFKKAGAVFDLIIADVPCSGEGLFRKDPDAITEWSPEQVAICATRQSSIMQDIVHCLKPGGILVYSTCTYEKDENDKQIEKLLRDSTLKLVRIETKSAARKTEYGLQCYPHLHKGEGFYLAVLQKEDGEPISIKTKEPKNKGKITMPSGWLNNTELSEVLQAEDRVHILTHDLSAIYNYLKNYIYIREAGLMAGRVKGKDFVPSHNLALSINRNNDLEPIELDRLQALQYLKAEIPKGLLLKGEGWKLMTYEGLSLGWIKAVQGRINNYFPKKERILMDI